MKEICNSLQHPKSVGQNTVHISQRLAVGELFRLEKDPCCTIGELHDCAYNLSSPLHSQSIQKTVQCGLWVFLFICCLKMKNS